MTDGIASLWNMKVPGLLRPMRYAIGDVLLKEVEIPAAVYFAGTSIIAIQGASLVDAAIVGGGGIIGASAAMAGKPSRYRASTRVAGDGYSCPAEEFVRTVFRDQELLAAAIGAEQQLTAECAATAACNAMHRLDQRLASWLLRLFEASGQKEFVATQEQIASWLGVLRTTTSLSAARLRRSKAISYTRGKITILDIEKLRHMACGCFRSDVEENAYRTKGRADEVPALIGDGAMDHS